MRMTANIHKDDYHVLFLLFIGSDLVPAEQRMELDELQYKQDLEKCVAYHFYNTIISIYLCIYN